MNVVNEKGELGRAGTILTSCKLQKHARGGEKLRARVEFITNNLVKPEKGTEKGTTRQKPE